MVPRLVPLLDASTPPKAASAAADWSDSISGEIPDLGDLLWRHPFSHLALVRCLAVLAGLLRPGRRARWAGGAPPRVRKGLT